MILDYIFNVRILCAVGLAVIALSCKQEKKKDTLFRRLSPSETSVDFENTLTNSPDFNIIEYLYFYNGGGVAIGDINNDGLADVYFSSNQQSNKLYLNKGNFQFVDITNTAGASGTGNWKTGVTMADVNGDGFLDIFICGVGNYKKFDGRNQLLINNGNLTFTDKTSEYGLNFQGFSSQASFFDYDNDGDLDMFLVNHAVHTVRSYGPALELRYQTDSLAGDKLYRNELIPGGHTKFTDVTTDAGIFTSQIGYGLAAGVSDLNQDGNMDIYVSNDFNENDYLYINNGSGKFTEQVARSIPHTSRFSMGSDISDINNDGLTDIFTLDMLPKDETVIKTTAGEDDYEIYDFKLRYGYHHQFLRNMLQLNRGMDEERNLMFSDIAPFAGVEATDWSWSPLFADFNNDGYKDLFVTTGIVGRPNGLDYINYISHDSAQFLDDQQLVDQMPDGKVPNVAFRNSGNLTFEDVSGTWMENTPSLSNGSAYGDLDNDGDLDLVVNNINEKAFLYRNDSPPDSAHFIKIKFDGESANRFGIGASARLYAGQQQLFYEQVPVRGWLSSVDYVMHVGLGTVTRIDSIVVKWPGNKTQLIKSVAANQMLVVHQKDATPPKQRAIAKTISESLVKPGIEISFTHKENTFIAFSRERLIPHMLSTQGPHIAVGDCNGDGREDFFVCGATNQSGAVFFQGEQGEFSERDQPALALDAGAEDVDAAFFDADGDHSNDLIVVSGGQESSGKNRNLLPRLYLNDGKGNFKKGNANLPEIFVNASCVRPADVDNDGDIDVFIGGRVVPDAYGIDPPSYLLMNDGHGKFTETRWVVGQGEEKPVSLGMVTDAAWVDLNKDSRPDLVVVGEWMPVTVLIQNVDGIFENKTAEAGLSDTNGWWNTLVARDFDGDGDLDMMAGNLGLNSRLRASRQEPVDLFINDLDENNSLDHVLTYFNQGKRYPLMSRNQLIKQVPSFRRKFLKYEAYKNVVLEDIIKDPAANNVIRKEAFTFASAYFENSGNGSFTMSLLPVEAQLFPLYSFCVADLNQDGHPDVLAGGNFFETQPEFGRYDAGYGLTLLGDGKGKFKTVKALNSGFIVSGQVRDIKAIDIPGNKRLFLISRNNERLKVFQATQKVIR